MALFHTFKNYFIIVFLVFNNKRYPKDPKIIFDNESKLHLHGSS